MTDSSIIENLRELVRVSFFLMLRLFSPASGGGGGDIRKWERCLLGKRDVIATPATPSRPEKKKKKSRVGRSTGTRPAHGRFARTGKLASKIETTALAHRFVIGSKLRRGKNV